MTGWKPIPLIIRLILNTKDELLLPSHPVLRGEKGCGCGGLAKGEASILKCERSIVPQKFRVIQMQAWLGRMGFVAFTGTLIWLATQSTGIVHSQTATGGGVYAEGLQIRSTVLATGIEQVTVVDSQLRSMAVYHIDPANGKIQLKSVRSLALDLQMEHFNGQSPLPSELRQVQPK